MFGRSDDPALNDVSIAKAFKTLRAFKNKGGTVLWTIHNDAPHKAKDLEAFAKARRELAGLADLILVHAEHAADHMVNAYNADRARLHVVQHPSYLEAYEPAATTLKRRLTKTDTKQFLFFGMFRGPKGVHAIQDVASKFTRRDIPFHLRMYGKAFSSQARLLRRLEANPNVDLKTSRVPDEDIPKVFAASHVFLAPYQSLFTSGSVMLALTFGLPIIGPNIREMRETTPKDCHHLLYDPTSPRGLIKAMLAFVEMDRSDVLAARRACFEFAEERAPQVVGVHFRKLLQAASKHDEPRPVTQVKAVRGTR